MFRSATDHHQEVHVFLVKITELKCEYSYVVMLPHIDVHLLAHYIQILGTNIAVVNNTVALLISGFEFNFKHVLKIQKVQNMKQVKRRDSSDAVSIDRYFPAFCWNASPFSKAV
jgi:hypothetical protein